MTTIGAARGRRRTGPRRDYLPSSRMRNGELAIEHGLHQEIGWERQTDSSDVSVMFFADNIRNPIIEAASPTLRPATRSQLRASLLYDQASGMLRSCRA